MKLIAVLLFLMATMQLKASEHPIYDHIKRLRPDMNNMSAMSLSNIIYKYSKKYKTNPHITVAIAMQESGLRNVHRVGRVYTGKKVVKGYTDLGMFQIHIRTIEAYGFDAHRIMTDVDYAAECHFKILKNKIKVCKHLDDKAWTCYHSKTPIFREYYKEKVERYL